MQSVSATRGKVADECLTVCSRVVDNHSLPAVRLLHLKSSGHLSAVTICENVHEGGPTPVVALITAMLIGIALTALVIPIAKRRPVGTPLTWGEAMVASVYTFFLFIWFYGIIPHLWLTWADNELNWRPDKLLFGPGDVIKPQAFGGWFPVTVSYQTIRDIIAVLIYVVFLGAQIALWVWWQKRDKRAAAASTVAVATSDYGRPLVRKS